MALPSDADYNIAIQNPAGCFDDPVLRRGVVELGPLGLPKARSGNFAVVYKVTTDGVPWAVRCFTKPIQGDQSERYAAIARHLKKTALRYCVAFEFLPRGIRVGSAWHPVVKMQWANGESLSGFVEHNRNSPAVLLELARSWVQMCSDLHAVGVAHGDLQHGNVIVGPNRDLRLVDYDGMFVPDLEGRPGTEDGHPNYQHPNRTGTWFGPELDNFSAWVVFISLVALAGRPELWDQCKAGDDCLLFRSADFREPDRSEAFFALTAVRDHRVRAAVLQFKGLLLSPGGAIPALTTQVIDAPPTGPSVKRVGLPDWVAPHVGPSLAPSSMPTPPPGAGWVLDVLAAEAPALRPAWKVGPERGVFCGLGIVGIGIAWFGGAGQLVGVLELVAAATMSVGFAGVRYLASGEFAQISRRRGAQDRAKLEFAAAQRSLSILRMEVERSEKSIQHELADLDSDLEALKLERERQLGSITRDAVLESASVVDALAQANRRRREELARVEAANGPTVASKVAELDSSRRSESNERSRALNLLQAQWIEQNLKSELVRDNLPELPRAVVNELARHGIRNAFEVTQLNRLKVPGVGPVRLRLLFGWQSMLEVQARSRAPAALPPDVLVSIRAKHTGRQQVLEMERVAAQSKWDREREAAIRRSDAELATCAECHRVIAVEKMRLELLVDREFQSRSAERHEEHRQRKQEIEQLQKLQRGQLAEARRIATECEWKHELTLREVERSQGATFFAYLRSIVSLRG